MEIGLDVADAGAVAERREEVLRAVRDHAGRIARELAVLDGGDYGRETFRTDTGTWTVKYEAGDLEFLLFEGRGSETYVVSTKRDPDPEALATAMADYEAFVAAFDEHVASLAGVLDEVPMEFPEVASTAEAAAERDRVLSTIRETADAMAGELHRYEEGDYGTFAARIEGTRWELKWEGDRASYLRVGGDGGTYLLSQYGPPSVPDTRELVGSFPAFVGAFNDHVVEVSVEATGVTHDGPRPDPVERS
ncbi:MAG: hypothetical protein V5A62_18840 [Haloarculaceae archaeon]